MLDYNQALTQLIEKARQVYEDRKSIYKDAIWTSVPVKSMVNSIIIKSHRLSLLTNKNNSLLVEELADIVNYAVFIYARTQG